MSKAKKTRVITFRLDEETIEKLKKESEHQDLSINNFVNLILKRYFEWDIYETSIEMIPVAKSILRELFNNMTKEQIHDIAMGSGKKSVRDIILFITKKIDANTFFSVYKTRMKNSAVDIKHTVENVTNHTYIIKHDLGQNWSFFQKIIIESIFHEYIKKPIDIKISENIVIIKYDE